ncbi:hypothetical protein L596_007927 [Steinernema carpocapsae]|uniref:SUI1 domain-containing protein n=1 Tax=Steinernema carpocapsae TaxID=34508 RepID=A0A4U5PB34_STECR|nr:hypothetical protein L596_007927 [Steinernema carpocapsae]
MSSIQNLNKPKDAFEQLEDEEGTRQGFCHIRIQQRTGRKTITTVQGVAPEYDLKKIVRYLKKCRCSERKSTQCGTSRFSPFSSYTGFSTSRSFAPGSCRTKFSKASKSPTSSPSEAAICPGSGSTLCAPLSTLQLSPLYTGFYDLSVLNLQRPSFKRLVFSTPPCSRSEISPS